jgi:hypothetical protein
MYNKHKQVRFVLYISRFAAVFARLKQAYQEVPWTSNGSPDGDFAIRGYTITYLNKSRALITGFV